MTTRRPRRSASQWQALLEQHAASGLSAKDFCRQHQLTYSGFMNWKRKLSQAISVVPVADQAPTFIELTQPVEPPTASAASPSTPPWFAELDLGPGIQLRIAHAAP